MLHVHHDASLLFCCCFRQGVLGQDADLAKWLRKHCSAPVLLAANKAERRSPSGAAGLMSKHHQQNMVYAYGQIAQVQQKLNGGITL